MPYTVLDVQAMPRAERSRTRKLHDAFMRGLAAKHPDLRVIVKDVAHSHDQLPAWDEWDVEAKFQVMYGEGKLDEVSAQRWESLTRLTDELHASNLVVISAPMWNFGVPWFLKRWLDAVVQARLTFEAREGTYVGLLAGRRAVILTTRDGAYAPPSPWASHDFHVPYLKSVLGLMGLGPIEVVAGEPLYAAGPEVGARALEQAVAAAESLGRAM